MSHSLAKIRALSSFLLRARTVSPRWLLRTHTRLFENFLRDRHIEVDHDGRFIYLRVDGVPFVWPKDADVEPLKHLVAELTTTDHPHQYDFGLTRLTPRDVVLDIGCCEGAFAALAAERGASVVGVEPSQLMRAVIERLFELRALPKPHIEACVLGSAAGHAYFRDDPLDPARSQITAEPVPGSVPLRVRTLDGLVEQLPSAPTYIKCDAEGADLDILQGGRSFLQRARPKVAVTTYHESDHFARIESYLESLGYICEGKGLMFVGDELRVMMIHAA